MAEPWADLAAQAPIVVATFGFCAYIVKLIFDKLITLSIERIIEQFRLHADRQHDQMELLISLFKEHVRGNS